MKKKVLAAMLVAAMTATMFAGCGSKDKFLSQLTPAVILLPSMQQTDVQSSEMVQMHLRDMTSAETTL